MNGHDNEERWDERRHRHHGGGRRRPRPGFPEGPGFPAPGFEAAADDSGFAAEQGFGAPGLTGQPGFRDRRGGPRGLHGGPPGFGPWPGADRRRGRAKRGDVRAAALALLAEEPMNGYQIIQQISDRSGGLWRPSPGSVYPALAQLEDESLIEPQGAEGGRRAYALTEDGRAYVAEHAQELKAPWSAMTGDAASAADMRTLVHQVHLAAFQVVSAGTAAQVNQARTVLTQARRSLYRILAEDEAPDGEPGGRD